MQNTPPCGGGGGPNVPLPFSEWVLSPGARLCCQDLGRVNYRCVGEKNCDHTSVSSVDRRQKFDKIFFAFEAELLWPCTGALIVSKLIIADKQT